MTYTKGGGGGTEKTRLNLGDNSERATDQGADEVINPLRPIANTNTN